MRVCFIILIVFSSVFWGCSSKTSVEIDLFEVQQLVDRKEYDKALVILNDALDRNPSLHSARYLRTKCLWEPEQDALLLSDLNLLLATPLDTCDTLYQVAIELANNYDRLNRFDSALNALQVVTTLRSRCGNRGPSAEAILNWRVGLNINLGRFEAARWILDSLTAKGDSGERLFSNWEYFYTKSGKYDSALYYQNLIIQEIEKEPGSERINAFYFTSRGNTYKQLGRMEEACADWHLALSRGDAHAAVMIDSFCTKALPK